jgi:hypothetical protein
MITLGIDVGKDGGIAIGHQERIQVRKLPTDIMEVNEILKGYLELDPDLFVVIEHIRFYPQDLMGQNAFGRVNRIAMLYGQYMQIKTLLMVNNIPHMLVQPKQWQEIFKDRNDNWKDLDKTDRKRLFKEFAQTLTPDRVTLSTADAVCILDYHDRSMKYNQEYKGLALKLIKKMQYAKD